MGGGNGAARRLPLGAGEMAAATMRLDPGDGPGTWNREYYPRAAAACEVVESSHAGCDAADRRRAGWAGAAR